MLVACINFSSNNSENYEAYHVESLGRLACKNIHRELTSWKSFFWQKIVGATK